MAQVLEGVPSFGQSFARSLGSGLSQGINRGLDFKKDLALQSNKNESFSQMFGKEIAVSDLPPEKEALLALTNPQAFNAYKAFKEGKAKQQKEVQEKENITNVMSEMANTLKGGNLGYTPARFATAKGRRDSQYFNTLSVQLESIGKDLVSKGVLSAPRFAFLMSNLPSSHKDDASNAGALEAWSDELGIPRPEGLEELYSDKKSEKKQSQPKEQSSKSDMVKMVTPDGKERLIPKSKVNEAIQAGGKVIK